MATTTEKTTVTVERETRKALLVSADGRKGWIQRRWFKDGQVSAATFEKAVALYEEAKDQRAAATAWRNDFHEVRVDRETEKAFATQVTFCSGDNEQEVQRMLWFPKSACKGYSAPGWMIEAKVDECLKSFPSVACAYLDIPDNERLFNY